MATSDEEYFDGLEITFYELLDPITKRPGLDVELEIDPSAYLNVRTIIAEIREALADGGVQDCVVLERRRTEFDWGASGVGEVILVGIATTYLADGLKAVFKRLVTKHSSSVMEEGAAIDHARQRVAIRYNLDVSDLELASVVTTADSVTVTLRRANGGTTFAVTIVGQGAGARATRIERIESADGASPSRL